MRDETDLNGLKLTRDLKRGVDADKLMAKLFKATPLEDSSYVDTAACARKDGDGVLVVYYLSLIHIWDFQSPALPTELQRRTGR